MHHGHLASLIHDKDRPAVAQPGVVDRDLDGLDPGAAAIPHLVRLTRIAHHDHRLEPGDSPGYRRIVLFGPVEHRAPKGLSRPGRPGHQRGLVRPPFGWHAEPLFTGSRHGLPPVLLPAGVELGPYHALADLEHSPSRHPFVAEHDRLPQAIDQGRQPNGEVIGVALAELAGRLAALEHARIGGRPSASRRAWSRNLSLANRNASISISSRVAK